MANGNESAINIILRFLTDQGSAKQAREAIKSIEDQAVGLGKSVSGSQVTGAGFGQSTEKIREEFEAINKEVEFFKRSFGATTEEAAEQLEGMASGLGKTKEEIIEIVEAGQRMGESLSSAGESAEDVEQKEKDAAQAAKDHEMQIAAVRSQYIRLGRDAQRLNRLGFTLSLIGAAISGPILLATRKSVQSLGLADATTREWLESTGRLENAQIRIGRVGAQAILPVMDRIASLSERAARFAEENPDAVRNVLAVGGALVGIGALTSALSRGIKLYADLKVLAAAALQNTAADKMLKAAGIQAGAAAAMERRSVVQRLAGAAGTAARFGGVAAAGIGFQALLARGSFGIGGKIADLIGFDRAGAFKDIAARIGQALNSQRVEEGILSIGRLAGVIDDLAESANNAEGEIEPERIIPQEAVDAFIQFRKSEVDAERQYSLQRNQIVEQYAQERVEIESQYESQRNQLIQDFQRSQAQSLTEFRIGQTRAARDFAQSQAESEKTYYDRRAKLAEEYQIDVQRAEEDHQRRIRQMREEHEARLEDLVDARDALGILREQRDFERQRREAEEEYQVESRRRSEDFARRLAEQEGQFAQERASRLAQFQQRQADELADFQRRRQFEQEQFEQRLKQLDEQNAQELAKLEANQKQELAQLDQHFREDQSKRRRAFADQLRDLGDALGFERDLRNQFYAAMAQDLAAWVAIWENQVGSNLPDFPSAPGRQSGGYVRSGLYRLHDDEFVINPQTTKLLEGIVGGRLNQNRILAAVANGSGGILSSRMEINVNQNGWRMEGGFTAREKESFRKMARVEAEAGVLEALP